MSQKILKKRKKMVSSAMNHLKKLSGSSWAQGKHFVFDCKYCFRIFRVFTASQSLRQIEANWQNQLYKLKI